jgi:hypothetical protein
MTAITMSDQESPLPIPHRAWIYPTLIHGVVALVIVTRLLVSAPGYERFFRDNKLLLPLATEAFLKVGAWMQNEGPLLLVVVPGLLAVDALVLWLLGGWSRFEGQMWFFILLALLLGTWLLMEVSFFYPYFKLLEGMSR